MTPAQLESGYSRAYEIFYKWSSILRSARLKPDCLSAVRHLAYTGGWKKFEFFWGLIIKGGLVGGMRPLLEKILAGFEPHQTERDDRITSTVITPELLTKRSDCKCRGADSSYRAWGGRR